MGLGPRIEERIGVLKITQAELARRAGVPQTTINSLIRGGHRSSPHLVRIAQALDTSAAYLMGDTDDPKANGPEVPALSAAARELVTCFEALSARDRTALLIVAKAMSRPQGEATLHEEGAVYRVEDRHQPARLQEPRREYDARLSEEIAPRGKK